jgi:competence protein CoiA
MEIALVDGVRSLSAPGLKGFCPCCAQAVIAKCGSQLIWHWSHQGKRHCDPWWENESDWHRGWKAHFPERMHEVVQFDKATGEKHIADLKTDRGMVIEIQHSAMSLEELKAREAFYKHMIWIVDGRSFVKLFEVHPEPIPHPAASFLDDVVFFERRAWAFWRPSENEVGSSLVRLHKSEEIEGQIQEHYKGHHFFTWKRAREVWFSAKAPVLIDFGGPELYRICKYQAPSAHCVQRISKYALIKKNGGVFEKNDAENF